jgi:AcrR family transcriptional regulator
MARPASDIRARLIDAARARFLVEGVDGASLRDVARDAGTSAGIVGYWFPKKELLFDAVLEEAYAPIVADLERLLAPGRSARARLHDVVLRLADASAREIDALRLVAREAIGSASRRRRILRRFMRGHVPLLLATLNDGVRAGELVASVPVPLMLILFVGIAALPQVVRRGAGAIGKMALPSKQKLAEASIAIFWRAFGA